MNKKKGLYDEYGFMPKNFSFKNKAAFADFLKVSRKTVTKHCSNGKIFENKDKSIPMNDVNKVFAYNHFIQNNYLENEVLKVVCGQNVRKAPTVAAEKLPKKKEKIQSTHEDTKQFKEVERKTKAAEMLPGLDLEKLKKYLDTNQELDLSELNPIEIDYLLKVRKLQEQTIKVKRTEYELSIASNQNVPFENMKSIFDAIIQTLALQLRSGVGRGIGKKLKTEFEKLEAREASDVEIIGALDVFHGQFADEILRNTIEEIKIILKKEGVNAN